MKELIRDLYARYCSHPNMQRPVLEWMGVVGFFAFPLFYLMRFTGKLPARHDDLEWRLVASALCLALALRRWWPERLKPYYLGYSWVTTFYCLSFFLSYSLLQNNGATNSVVNMLIGAVFIVLLTDWRNTIVMLVLGYALGLALYALTSDAPQWPVDFLLWWVPLSALLVAGGSITKFGDERAELERMRLVYTGLAASIAHEMRNPLGQVKYSLDGIEHALPSPTAAALQALPAQKLDELFGLLSQGQTAIKRGLQVIAMTLNEVNARAIDTSGFVYLSAGQATQKAIDEYSYETPGEREKVRLNVIRDFRFEGDETIYVFVLFNLIKNALYYFKLHPEATITIVIDQPNVVVTDTGPGIPADVLPHLFEAFKTSGKAGGTGLGLSYCKRAMRAFGGDIACDSVPGEYTRFVLRFAPIPQEQFRARLAAQTERAAQMFDGQPILVVDDQPLLRRHAQAMLKGVGCPVDEAENGEQAIAMLRDKAYAAILMDINMPVLDGYVASERIRAGAVPGRRDVPILAYTSESAYMAGVKTQKVGMDGFLGKPCTQLELIDALCQAVDHARRIAHTRGAAAVPPGRTVAVADDDPHNRRMLRAVLEARGIGVLEAAHGQAVIDLLAAHRVDAILMDMRMPGMSGAEAARAIRAGTVQAQVPILALTANSTEASVAATRAAGMNDFIQKPFDPEVLIFRLARHLAAAEPAGAPAPSAPLATVPAAAANGMDGIDIVIVHPQTPPAPARAEPAAATGTGPERKTVLLAEEDPGTRRSLRDALERDGMRVVEAQHGGAVLKLLEGAAHVDALVLDVCMAERNGVEVASAIRTGALAHRRLPIIALAEDANLASLQAAYLAGANDYLTRPVQPAALREKLGRQLAHPYVARQAWDTLWDRIRHADTATDLDLSLLDLPKLRMTEEAGLLDDVPRCVGTVGKLGETLRAAARDADLAVAHDALHALAGLSGLVGMEALYQLVRRLCVPVENGRWPDEAGWPAQVDAVIGASQRALTAYYLDCVKRRPQPVGEAQAG